MDIVNIIFTFVIIILSFWKKRERFVFFLILLYCFILMGFNNQNPDYNNYVMRFDNASYPNSDSILQYLDITDRIFQAFCKDVGIKNYETFRLIQAGIIFFFLGGFVYKECYYRNILLMIYLLCYLLRDIIIIRNTFAFAILLPFFPILAKKKLKSTLLFVCGVLFSATIHFSMFLFMIFALIGLKSNKKKMAFLILFLLVMIPLLNFFESSAISHRVEGYDRSSFWGGLSGAFMILINFFISTRFVSSTPPHPHLNLRNRTAYVMDNLFFKEINVSLFALTPFFFFNASVGRLFHFISILNLIFMLNFIHNTKSKKKRDGLIALIIVYAIFFAIRYVYIIPNVLDVVKNNSLLSLLL